MHKPVRILLIDDNPYFSEAARDYLLLKDSVELVETAVDGDDALTKAQNGDFDVILMDLNLPGRSGLDLIPVFRKQFANTKIIALSMLDDASYRLASLQAGADDFVQKSRMSKTLVNVIRNSVGYTNPPDTRQSHIDAENTIFSFKLGENAQDQIYHDEFKPERGFTYVSPSAADLTGYTPTEHSVDRDLGFKLVHPENRLLLENLAPGEDILHAPLVLSEMRKDVPALWTEQRNIPIFNDNSDLVAIDEIASDITTQEQAVKALRQIKDRFRDLVENSQEIIYTHDLEGRILSANPAATRLLGYEPGRVLLMNIRDILSPEVRDQFQQFIERLRHEGNASGLMHVRTAADESRIWEYYSSLHTDGANASVVRSMARDVTDRVHAELSLKESRQYLASVINSAMDAVIVVDHNQRVMLFNPAAEKMFLCAAAEATGSTIDRFIPERSRSVYQKYATQFGQSGQPKREMNSLVDIYGLRSNGEEFPIEASLSSTTSAGQRYYTMLLRDITERRQAEKALQASEKQYREIFNGVQDAILVESLDGQVLAVNDRACEMHGYTREEFLTKTIFDLVPVGQPIMMVGKEDVSLIPVESVNLRANGEHFPVEISGRMQNINGDNEEVLLIIVRDITERKLAEQGLQESEAALRKAQQVAHVGSWIWDIPENRLKGSDEMFRLFGFEQSSFTGIHVDDIYSAVHPDDRAALEQALQAASQGKRQVPQEYRIILPDGKVRTVWAEAGEITLDSAGQPIALSGIVQDITEHKQAEERLRESKQFLRDTMDALSAHIAILDETGTIIAVNESWRKFGRENGLAVGNSGVGCSYQEISKSSVGEDAVTSLAVARAIEEMLVTGMPEESQAIEYPCHSPWEKRWFIARLTKFFEHGKARVVVSHENITTRVLAEEKTKQQLLRLAALREIDLAITSSFDIWASLNVLLNQTLRLLNVDATSIMITHPETGTVDYFAGSGFKTTRPQAEKVKLGESYAGKVALERRTIQIPDLATGYDAQFYTKILKDEGFVSYYGIPMIVKDEVIGVLEVYRRSFTQTDDAWLGFLETLAGQAAIAIDNSRLFADIQRANSELLMAYDTTIEGWSHAMDLRDKETEGHTLRVTDLTMHLARIFGIGEDDLVHIRRGCLLHDIGKMGVPDHILLKPEKLSDEEWVLMRQHPEHAYEMLSSIAFLKPSLDIPYCHHEKWDGTGYPRGLKGEQIPFTARLFALVDVWDALTNDRPYRPAWTREAALAYVREQSGEHFDPQVVELFLQVMDGNIESKDE